MPGIAVQGFMGEAGAKPGTYLDPFDFNSMAVINGVSLGTSAEGLHRLNTGDRDSQKTFQRSLTFATSDFGSEKYKKIRFLYLGLSLSSSINIIISTDRDAQVEEFTVDYEKDDGLQRIRVPVETGQQGRFYTIKIDSGSWFSVDSVEALFIDRPDGIGGY